MATHHDGLPAVRGIHYPIPRASGTEVSCALTSAAASSIAGAANRLECFPFIPMNSLTIDRIALETATGVASATYRIGIYDDVNGTPTTLLCGGVTSHDGATSSTDRTEAVSLTMAAGVRYWFAVHSSSTAQYRGIPIADALAWGFSVIGSGSPITAKRNASVSYASGMPTTCPAMTDTAGVILPLMRVRVA